MLFVNNEGRKLGGWWDGVDLWSCGFGEEINYELEMDIELIVSRVEEPHIRQGVLPVTV